MRTITLTADDGEVLTGQLPDSWAEVPIQAFARLAGAVGLVARIEATAALVGLPAGPLLDDVALFAQIAQATPWLWNEPLPAGTDPAPSEFTHNGTRYVSTGHLEKLNTGQWEQLHELLAAYEGRPLEAAPGILAVLYCPKGKKQTPEVAQAAMADLATLPVSVAYPLLVAFTMRGASASHAIGTYLALRPQVAALLDQVEATMNSASSPWYARPLTWNIRRWIKSARAQL